MCAEHFGAPYDLLASALAAQPARLRAITARWRRAGFAATGRLGPGPAWCWLTPAGMAAAGLGYPAARPPLARLAHLRAVLAARLWFQSSPAWDQHGAWWQSERRIRRKGPAAGTHRPRRGDLVAVDPGQPVRRADLGHRDRVDRQARRPHRRHHGRADRPGRVRPRVLPDRPGRARRGGPLCRRAATRRFRSGHRVGLASQCIHPGGVRKDAEN
ncbi:MAG: hypothetical protein ACRDP5_14285 [Streptosporangiaceae bacterium]